MDAHILTQRTSFSPGPLQRLVTWKGHYINGMSSKVKVNSTANRGRESTVRIGTFISLISISSRLTYFIWTEWQWVRWEATQFAVAATNHTRQLHPRREML